MHERVEEIINFSILYYALLVLLRLVDSYGDMVPGSLIRHGIIYGTWIYLLALVVTAYRGWKEFSKLDFRVLAVIALSFYTQMDYLL